MEWVYDRTQEDVERAKLLTQKYAAGAITETEKKEWASGMKGALNASDLNRIEGNIREIAGILAINCNNENVGKESNPTSK